MKKLKLAALQFGATEVLTRAQLKNVLGGDGSGGAIECKTDADCGPAIIIVCGREEEANGICKTNTHTCSWGSAGPC